MLTIKGFLTIKNELEESDFSILVFYGAIKPRALYMLGKYSTTSPTLV
jgi:hypothetical protein